MRVVLLFLCCVASIFLQAQDRYAQIEKEAAAVEKEVIEWRRHFHENPELSNREFKTAETIATYLKELGLEVETGIAHTGVTGFLRGGQPGPTVALRADIDALPVRERVDIPFASKATTTYLGEEVGVMHACGHDTHTAMLMGAAKILTNRRATLKGNILFIFQPAEEGAPPGEEGGAELMLKEGMFEKFKPDVVFGLHINSQTPVGMIRYKPGGAMAASDRFVIKVNGKQAHGSRPWSGVDPITVSAQIIMGLQTIVSRQMDLTNEAVVITVGKIKGGVRNNIIPETCEMIGTIRTLDTDMQDIVHAKIKKTAELIAESAGATVDVEITKGNPVTYNNPALTQQMLPTVFKTAGENNVLISRPVTGAEDFSFYAREIPGLFLFLGGMDPGKAAVEAPSHHTPDFYINEDALKLGVKTLSNLTLDYMDQNSSN